MRKILYLIIGLCLLVSCSEESQQRNEALKNEWFDLSVSEVSNFKNECKQCEEILKALQDNPFI